MKTRPRRPSVFAFCAFFILSFRSVPAEPAILFDIANPPFMYERGGAPAGIYPAVVAEAFRRMNQAVSLRAEPWNRALLGIAAGTSGIGGVYRNSTRDLAWDFSDAIYEETTMLYVARGGDFRFNGLADLRGKKIGVLRGWSYGDAFDSAVREGLISVEDEYSDMVNFRKLAAGRLDAVIAIRESGDEYLGFMSAGLHRLPGALTVNKTYLAFSKNAKMGAVIAAFNSALDSMKKDGTFDKILQREQSVRGWQ